MPRSQPRVLGGSKGREAPPCFSIYLFVGPVYTFQALITPGGREEGHTAAAWAFDVWREEMMRCRGVPASLGCVCLLGSPGDVTSTRQG